MDRSSEFLLQPPANVPSHQTQGRPEKGKEQADLPPVVSGQIPVVPDPVVPVEGKSNQQLSGSADGAAQPHAKQRMEFGVQPPQGQKAGTSQREHGPVAPPPPQKLQRHIDTAANGKYKCLFEHEKSPYMKYVEGYGF